MRLGVDARVLSHRPTGVSRYLAALLDEYGQSRRAGEILELFVDRALPVPPPAAVLPGETSGTPRAPGGERRVAVLRWPLPGGDPAWRQLRLAAHFFLPPRPDVLFCPFYTVPLLARVPRVVTIHDVSFLAHPEWFTRRARLAFSLVRPSAHAARFVVTVSRFSATEIMRRLGLPAQRIAVIPPGIAADWSRPVEAGDRADLRQWLGHSGPYLLHLGAVQRRRNVDVVLRAFARLVRSHPELKLVIAGPTLDRVPDLARAATELQLGDKVLRREWVPEPHLRPLLAEATALIYLSSYEGFGLPALEAMATGAPVVALRRASLPEVLGDAAAFVDEPEAARLAAVIDGLLRDTTWSAELRRLGAERAALFSTRVAAERTFDLLREVAAGR
ncbi:MAG: glycosyltransferase family 4 protein [Acidobacteriota bacterium]|nr:glycosyltransferase family 4 protein [Acidobacteriota bacterium]